MKKIVIINKLVFVFKYFNIVFFFNLESKSTLNIHQTSFVDRSFEIKKNRSARFSRNMIFPYDRDNIFFILQNIVFCRVSINL